MGPWFNTDDEQNAAVKWNSEALMLGRGGTHSPRRTGHCDESTSRTTGTEIEVPMRLDDVLACLDLISLPPNKAALKNDGSSDAKLVRSKENAETVPATMAA